MGFLNHISSDLPDPCDIKQCQFEAAVVFIDGSL